MILAHSQSLFIEKLHDLLERPFDETGLRWVSDTAFEIIDDDVKARHSLSATWDFRLYVSPFFGVELHELSRCVKQPQFFHQTVGILSSPSYCSVLTSFVI